MGEKLGSERVTYLRLVLILESPKQAGGAHLGPSVKALGGSRDFSSDLEGSRRLSKVLEACRRFSEVLEALGGSRRLSKYLSTPKLL